MHDKVKFVCFNYMQLQKVKFKSVQINMQQVSFFEFGPAVQEISIEEFFLFSALVVAKRIWQITFMGNSWVKLF